MRLTSSSSGRGARVAKPASAGFFRTAFALVVAAGALLFSGAYAWSAEIAAPYVPTAPSVVERMLEVAKVGPDDFVIDLGSGDGRIIVTAARKYGAAGMGIEIDPTLIAQAQENARAAGVDDRVRFIEDDLFAADLSQASVVTIYLLNRATMKLRDRLFNLRPGTRIVSHAAAMGEWRADHFEMMDVKDKVRPDAPKKTYLHYWVVPAKVSGNWRWAGPAGQHYELTLAQQFQKLTGSLRAAGKEFIIDEGRLDGDRIVLRLNASDEREPGRYRLVGRVEDGSIFGTFSNLGDGTERSVRMVSSPQALVR